MPDATVTVDGQAVGYDGAGRVTSITGVRRQQPWT